MKVAIVGAEVHTRYLAPFDKKEYKIWVLNEWANADWCGRWDVLFQIHKPSIYRNLNNETDPKHWEWLQRNHGKPIYMQRKDPLVPDSVEYPFNDVLALMSTVKYEGKPQRYFRMSLAYAMGLAILKNVESIDIWGVELAYSAEYRSQQNCFAFWTGLATGRGIPVNLHCCKGMFDQPLYGYEEYMQEDKIQRYVEGLTQQIEEAKINLARLEGARMLAIQMLTDEKENNETKAQEQATKS